MRWELTELEYKKAGLTYDVRPDHRDRINFQKYCYDATTGEPFGPVTETIWAYIRVMHEGKQYFYTNRERTGLRSDRETPHVINIPEWEKWEKPIFDTIKIPDETQFGQTKTKTIGVKGRTELYLEEWDPVKFDEYLKARRWNAKFFVRNHGLLEPVLEVPDPTMFRNESFDYLYMKKWLRDAKYAEIAEKVRYQDAMNAQLQGGPNVQADIPETPIDTRAEVKQEVGNKGRK